MQAVSIGDKAEVQSLLSKGANPNASPPMVYTLYKHVLDDI